MSTNNKRIGDKEDEADDLLLIDSGDLLQGAAATSEPDGDLLLKNNK